MTVIDDYVSSLAGPEQVLAKHMVSVIRRMVPSATEEQYYALPAFKYEGKGLASIVVNKKFLSLYPFCAVERLGIDLSAFECSSGSIHFTTDHPVPDALFATIIAARVKQIEASVQ